MKYISRLTELCVVNYWRNITWSSGWLVQFVLLKLFMLCFPMTLITPLSPLYRAEKTEVLSDDLLQVRHCDHIILLNRCFVCLFWSYCYKRFYIEFFFSHKYVCRVDLCMHVVTHSADCVGGWLGLCTSSALFVCASGGEASGLGEAGLAQHT